MYYPTSIDSPEFRAAKSMRGLVLGCIKSSSSAFRVYTLSEFIHSAQVAHLRITCELKLSPKHRYAPL